MKQQQTLMKFDPATCEEKPYPSNAEQYREYHGKVAWLFNPWTGDARDAYDIGSDTFGQLIQQPSKRKLPECVAEHEECVKMPYDEKYLHHPDTGTGWRCYVCGHGGAANNYANTFCVNCTDEDG